MKYNIASVIFSLLFFSCINQEPTSSSSSDVFSMDSLITAQINYLSGIKASVNKQDTKEGSTLLDKLDSTQWENQLQIFRELSIDKPSIAASYKTEIRKDSVSNLSILHYYTDNPKLEVTQLNIYYLDQLSDVKKITAKRLSKSVVYSSSLDFLMKFRQMNGKSILSEYSIDGVQKTVSQDTVHTSLRAKISL